MRTTAKDLNEILVEIAKRLDLATTKEEAEKKSLKRYLQIEHNSNYGGYRVVNVSTEHGGHAGAFGGNGTEPRLKANEMYLKLSGILTGIEYAQAINN